MSIIGYTTSLGCWYNFTDVKGVNTWFFECNLIKFKTNCFAVCSTGYAFRCRSWHYDDSISNRFLCRIVCCLDCEIKGFTIFHRSSNKSLSAFNRSLCSFTYGCRFRCIFVRKVWNSLSVLIRCSHTKVRTFCRNRNINNYFLTIVFHSINCKFVFSIGSGRHNLCHFVSIYSCIAVENIISFKYDCRECNVDSLVCCNDILIFTVVRVQRHWIRLFCSRYQVALCIQISQRF